MAGMVVVGGGQAGFSVASSLRNLGYDGELILICEEDILPYQRPPLSKQFLLGEMDKDRLLFRKASFYQENRITVKTGVKVITINREKKQVTLGDVTEITYEKLFLTTGAIAQKMPGIFGGDHHNLFYVRSVFDIEEIRKKFQNNKRLLVIGGGYIGLEVAAVASKMNLIVTVVEAQERILKRVATKYTSDFFRSLHLQNNVDIVEGNGVKKLIVENNKVISACLNDGQNILCDLVIAGIGVLPNTCLAEQAGIRVDNGILVDKYCRTSDPYIFAAGDCTNFPDGEDRLRLESVGNAIDQGENAAANALELMLPYEVKPWFWSDQYSTKLQMAGLARSYDQVVSRNNKKGGLSFWYFKNKKLIAVESINDAKSYMIGKKLIESGDSPEFSLVSDLNIDIKSLLKKP